MWAESPLVPGIQVSDQGIVKGPRKELSQWPDERGCMRVKAGGRPYAVHLLVLTAFVGPRPDGASPRWLNGDPTDNRLVNLTWQLPDEPEVLTRINRCRNGHVYSRENTKIWGSGHRICLDCERGHPPVTQLPEVL
ncbi:HNH endonuclease [Mycobacterium phage Lolly9]|uniref:HNH endonuclease n=1 Tax=Mycobacterium phage Lolly9 TaxID=1698711 RepID=A0A0K2FNY9_9CAUD|nr:HNH endonuclease [Mycobacterium phage Lolly9]ALA48508.1 HNH endonuclease [Mycobacterium phage Lolly9]QOP65819.1 HNH endonuclease [Mycobacterium phage MiniLon]QOP66566.1 HNH endonuclease [Mycobacterium phage MiniMac]